ncbi:LPS assembly lipoprotein LptE [Porticoccus litoralis]|jgi:LPS-assembly lipoprotein|uniref:LPS-assembly lipoprotein LptE n=1 Tax=Porticoccus litoralis TaxID=434086 RepID=A0AAW8B1E8_9GAMM|nr:LPS assembly lipoprotein LptE [Porticoccus litoralis]MDP1520203.1 LPS assembly lipoprotein LptE [Porticoccus litoralis]
MKKLSCLLITGLLVAATLSGCGWHLRGTAQVNNISSVHISAADRFNDFYESLSRSLEANDVVVENNATKAQYSVVILDQSSRRRTGSVSVSARVSEYQLTENVTMMILDGNGKTLLPRSTLTAERYFDFDENDVQSKEGEAEMLKREMRDDLVRQIIIRLNAIANRPAASSTSAEQDAAAH